MKRQELQAEYDRLSGQLKLISQSSGTVPDELVSMSCQQLCVAICGSLEQTLKSIFVAYGMNHSNKKIHRPIARVCEFYQNPKSSKILELVGMFDDDFERSLKELWSGEKEIERSQLDNLVDDRITIAHRKKVHHSVSVSKLQGYLSAYKDLTDRVFSYFLETPKP